MAFKKAPPIQNVPDSPEKLFLELPRRKIPDVLLHQGEIMRAYVDKAINQADVALQLPTGSGKTLVGLMIAEWRRRKFRERILYLCPTRQLVNQVVEQAEEQYGLTVNGFTGSVSGYDPTAKSQYQNGDRVAVTTYSALFNTNPFFINPEIIIVDDAHAAENYIASLWSLKIERNKDAHRALHAAMCGLLKPYIDAHNFIRLTGQSHSTEEFYLYFSCTSLYRVYNRFIQHRKQVNPVAKFLYLAFQVNSHALPFVRKINSRTVRKSREYAIHIFALHRL